MTIEINWSDYELLRLVAKREKATPEEALKAHVLKWLDDEAQADRLPGLHPAPKGMFPDDKARYYFVDPAEMDPERAEDYLTPEQRQQAIAEILATIALRVLAEERAGQAAGENSPDETGPKAGTERKGHQGKGGRPRSTRDPSQKTRILAQEAREPEG